MTAKDQLKIINAGFTIVRKDEQNLKIKFKGKGSHEWSTFMKGYVSKASLERGMKELLTSPTIVED